ncbi:MAG: hypothetical protein KAJ28_02805, partial [Flavobacteriaceae bacterium]|nr:hypothetical protein [Flavobacteriaceae bacterium]
MKSITGIFILMLFLLNVNVMFSQNIQGTAPVQTPLGGFGVDGDAFAGTPMPTYEFVGDWFFADPSDPVGADPGGIFAPDGLSLLYDNSFFYQDDITNNDPTIFTSSNKIDHDPSTYTWGAGSSPNKNEIQNVGAHFTNGDGVGSNLDDLWVLFAADRQVTNGSSYIDFEFLQKPLTMFADLSGVSGGFVTEGEDGGRTIGDILVTIEFTQGGVAANVVVRRWQPVPDTNPVEYLYYVYTNYPPGSIYGTNNTVETEVPFPIYNQPQSSPDMWEYAINQWAEGAVNLSALFTETDPCFNVSTLFIRTRTSGSSGTSELKDFPAAPVQLTLDLVPVAGLTTEGVCDGENSTFTATSSIPATFEFFADANSDGIVDSGESLQKGLTYLDEDTYTTISPLNDGDVISVFVMTAKGCTDVATASAIIWENPTANAGIDDED